MLELQRNVYVLRRWWWLLLAGAVIGGLIAYTATKAIAKPAYRATAIVALAPASAGSNPSYFDLLSAAADAQLVATLSTAQAAARAVPGVDARELASSISGTPSVDGELFSITLTWPDAAQAAQLVNAVATTYIQQERQRLAARYRLVHQGYVAQENRLDSLMNLATGQGPAQSWLASQYAATAAKIYQEDADAGIQASTQEQALQLAQPASTLTVHEVVPRAAVNGALGAALGLLVTLVFAYLATSSYEQPAATGTRIPTLTKVGE